MPTLANVITENKTFRIDSGFFNQEAFEIEDKIKKKDHFFLKSKEVVSGPFGSTLKSHSYQTQGVPFIRIENIKGGFNINTNNLVYISDLNNSILRNSQLVVNDIILSKVGNSIGYYARVDSFIGACNISENNIGIKLKAYSTSLKHYILTYLNSSFGLKLTLRRISGNAQPKLNVGDITEVPIPIQSNIFIDKISELIEATELNIRESERLYSKAEATLLEQANIKINAAQGNTNVKYVKSSFYTSGRLDAEYYQKKYDDLIAQITCQKHDKLHNIVDIFKSIEPGSTHYEEDEGLPFYRVSDYNKFSLTKADKNLKWSYVKNNLNLIDKLKPKKGSILFTKDGTIGIAYLLTEDLDGVTSSAILRLNIKDPKFVLPEYLTLVLNSKIVQQQAERDAGGSIILHWRKEEIEQVIIPIIDRSKQEAIANLVKESFKLKNVSERLLSIAKRAVEVAIEENELEAINYIKSNS